MAFETRRIHGLRYEPNAAYEVIWQVSGPKRPCAIEVATGTRDGPFFGVVVKEAGIDDPLKHHVPIEPYGDMADEFSVEGYATCPWSLSVVHLPAD